LVVENSGVVAIFKNQKKTATRPSVSDLSSKF
jgi:hypothetical protein